MSAYLVYVRDRISYPEEFKKYEESAPAASVGQPITPLAFYGAVETLEGLPLMARSSSLANGKASSASKMVSRTTGLGVNSLLANPLAGAVRV